MEGVTSRATHDDDNGGVEGMRACRERGIKVRDTPITDQPILYRANAVSILRRNFLHPPPSNGSDFGRRQNMCICGRQAQDAVGSQGYGDEDNDGMRAGRAGK